MTDTRLAVQYPDGSFGIFPTSYTVADAIAESHDPNETDPREQGKIVRVTLAVVGMEHDPATSLPPVVCLHCQKEAQP
jgi:hypothetical protein